ncbi:unnamed protein product [Brachionus calyciflorus]|uniref:MULE transposase domain-containing protein n=1 Tax=Brachionus calyciflorus TaxID=104777 RepID=A0A814AJ94_9BILA|nr:unnamed protein product [Brachionus calyciflorus]
MDEKRSIPFISKGKGKSLMVSDFLVAHSSCPFFSLDEEEWEKAIEKYPCILESHEINYEERTCTGSIVPGQNNYFNNKCVLNQFERLFQMLEFKKEFNFPVKHVIEIVVDNARTHTTQNVNIDSFSENRHWLCDRTFDVAPLIFCQMFSLQVNKNGKTSPVSYGLFSNKEQATYKNFFQFIKSKILNEPLGISSDFEISIINAIEETFEDTLIFSFQTIDLEACTKRGPCI